MIQFWIPVFCIVVADVKALYLNLCRDIAAKALECALASHSTFNTMARKIVVELNKFFLNNVVTQNCKQLYPNERNYNRW